MSKVEKNLQNIKRSRPTQLRNGNEVAFFEGTSSYMLNEKDRKGEYIADYQWQANDNSTDAVRDDQNGRETAKVQ